MRRLSRGWCFVNLDFLVAMAHSDNVSSKDEVHASFLAASAQVEPEDMKDRTRHCRMEEDRFRPKVVDSGFIDGC